jgi:hypothetical protein
LHFCRICKERDGDPRREGHGARGARSRADDASKRAYGTLPKQVFDPVAASSLDCRQPRRELRYHAAAANVRIDVTGAGFVLTKALRGDVRRRVLITMSRFGREVHVVSARLAVSQNPQGGVDRSCRVRARLQSGRVLRVEAVNGRIEAAVGRSMAHLALLVAEALDGGPDVPGGRRLALALHPRRPAE